jgi:small subunit ribosomal protein S2
MSENKDNTALIDEMFNAGVHYAYSRSRRHPSMKKWIYGVKNNVEIIDLEKTIEELAKAEEYVTNMAKEGKKILFVGAKNQIRDIVEQEAETINTPYVKNRWIGGTLTNFDEIKKRVQRFLDLTEKKEKGELGMYTKKERLLIDREIEDLEWNFGGVTSMIKTFPAAMFVVDPKAEDIAVKEAISVGMPIIAIVNSDADVSNVDYPIPANDSSRASVELIVSRIVNAYKKGQK